MMGAIKRAFGDMDTAQDDFVHPDELESYMKGNQNICNHALIVQMIRTFDQNGDGKLSLDELTAIAILSRRITTSSMIPMIRILEKVVLKNEKAFILGVKQAFNNWAIIAGPIRPRTHRKDCTQPYSSLCTKG
jgi:hypothetical protein